MTEANEVNSSMSFYVEPVEVAEYPMPNIDMPASDPEHYFQAAAEGKILSAYSIQQQLNILRKGDAKEVEKMGRFIDAVLAWKNGNRPDFSELEKIKA
ncbi:hypothetical protein [Chromobacterium haemolyticum]|uniref:hypothetical protein n=1 Tax=Chromobacterium haemolyticum TaxID=394935 RepID=UPI0012F7E842|nr:hypothetical protein [Chromobacterium haemolyticum]